MKIRTIFSLTIATVAVACNLQARAEVFEEDGWWYGKGSRYGLQEGEACLLDPNATYDIIVGTYTFPNEEGVVCIPSSVEHDGSNYTVTSVGCICNHDEVTALIFPATAAVSYGVIELFHLREIVFTGVERLLGPLECLPALTSMTFDSGNEINLGEMVLNGLPLAQWDIPSQIKQIPDNNFKYWQNLELLDFSSIKYFKRDVGSRNPCLKKLILPTVIESNDATITEGENANMVMCFNYLPSLNELTFPEALPLEYQIVNSFLYCNPKKIICKSKEPPSLKAVFYGPSGPALEHVEPPRPAGYFDSFDIDDYPITEDSYIGDGTIDLETCTVIVPVGSLEAYKNHPSWKMFKNIRESGSSQDGIDLPSGEIYGHSIETANRQIMLDGKTNGFILTNIQGQTIPNRNLPAGMYILKTSDGVTMKVTI